LADFGAIQKLAETLLKYWVPGRVSVSSDHDYYLSWK